MKNILVKSDYDGVTTPAPTDEVHSAEELNDRRVELQGAVTDPGQVLDEADAGQLSKAMFANGVGASSMIDSGAAGTVVLTPKTGASGLRVATPIIKDYSLLDGASFNFQANATNAGNVTVNVGQTVGTVIGAQPLLLQDGSTQVPADTILAGNYYEVRYDSTLDGDGAFVLMPVGTGAGKRISGVATPVNGGDAVNKDYADAAGTIKQVVNVMNSALTPCNVAIPYDDSIPQNTEGIEVMTLAITPTNTANKLKIEVTTIIACDSDRNIIAALFQDSTVNSLAAASMLNGLDDAAVTITFTFYMTAGTTSSTTFKVRCGSADGSGCDFNGSNGSRIFGGVCASSITISEIKV